MYGNSKHAYLSARNLFPIPIRCSTSMMPWTTSKQMIFNTFYFIHFTFLYDKHFTVVPSRSEGNISVVY